MYKFLKLVHRGIVVTTRVLHAQGFGSISARGQPATNFLSYSKEDGCLDGCLRLFFVYLLSLTHFLSFPLCIFFFFTL